MKLLSQGRAQGLFGPASPINPLLVAGIGGPVRGHAPPPRPLQPSTATSSALKRVRSEALGAPPSSNGASNIDASRRDGPAIQADRQPPAKRPRTESGASPDTPSSAQASPAETRSRPPTLVRKPGEGSRQADTTIGNRASSPAERPTSPATPSLPAVGLNGKQVNGTRFDPVPRFATKASTHRHADRTAFLRNPKRAMVLAAIQAGDEDTEDILRALGDAAEPPLEGSPPDVDIVLDDQGHTALHLASSLARLPLAQALVEAGADVTRGSFSGETPLIRTVLTTHAFEDQAFSSIVSLLHPSIRILDNSRRTVLHHVAHVAGIRGRAPAARYYMECVLMWIAQREGGDFKSVVDLQDEHGDTALNIAARVGNRSLVKMLLDVGANRITPNKLGLRPGDFGVEGEASISQMHR
jgi:regulatory protein SWI6